MRPNLDLLDLLLPDAVVTKADRAEAASMLVDTAVPWQLAAVLVGAAVKSTWPTFVKFLFLSPEYL